MLQICFIHSRDDAGLDCSYSWLWVSWLAAIRGVQAITHLPVRVMMLLMHPMPAIPLMPLHRMTLQSPAIRATRPTRIRMMHRTRLAHAAAIGFERCHREPLHRMTLRADPSDILVDDPSESPTPVTPAAGCGDWVIQEGEACDAGPRNGLDGAGCRSDCTFPQCGDGQRSPSEECDSDNDEACNVENCELELTLASVQEPTDAIYEVLAPDATTIFGDAMQTLASSEHFVIRASYDDVALMAEHQTPGGPLSEENQLAILGRLEEIWDFYIDELGFAPPYYDSPTPYKVNAVITDYGYLSGGTFQEPAWGPGQHPQIQMHYGATEGYHGMAHEFAHALQNMVSGADWFDYGGWFSESHAEFMAYQFNPDGVGCSEVLVNAPHHHYGTTRNRYCNWQFWDYVIDTLGAAAVNALWSGNINGPTFINPLDVDIPDSCSELDGPFAAFQRNLGWDIERLNDLFGRWALANIEWSYGKGPLFRNEYGDYVGDLEAGKRGRVTRLETHGEGSDRFYMPPDILAPQRWGYNVVQLFPDEGIDEFVVEFRGLVQAESARTAPLGSLNMEPDNSQLPDSGWRWGIAVIGRPRPCARNAASVGCTRQFTGPTSKG